MVENMVDFLSNLPHEILQEIVSRVPVKEAVRTSILSNSWKSHWTPIQINLDFDSNISHEISNFFKSCHSLQLGKFFVLAHEMERDGFVFSALKGKENELYLDFSERNKRKTENFKLGFDNPSICKHPTEADSFSSLKTLHFRSVNHLSKDLVSSLFTNCLVLESLKLEKCNGLHNIDFKGNNFFHSFVILDYPSMTSIRIFAPSLKTFWYRGVLPKIEMKNCQDLVDVVLNFREGLGHNEFDCDDILSLLASLKDIETLTISGWLLEWLCTEGVIFGRLEFKLNKLKELCWIGSSMDRAKRDSMACFLNISPLLEKMFINIDQSYNSIPPPFPHFFWHEPHLWMDYATVTCNGSQLEHLITVKLVGFTEEKDQLLLMDLLMKRAITLKSMTVISPDNKAWGVSKIPKSQLKQTLRGYAKQIGFSDPNRDLFFGLIEDHSNCDLHPANAQCL